MASRKSSQDLFVTSPPNREQVRYSPISVATAPNSSQELYVNDGFPVHPLEPFPLPRRLDLQKPKVLSHILCFGSTLPFVVLACIVMWYHEKHITPRELERLQLGLRLSATLFPVAFAAIVGRILRQIAQRRLELAVPLGALEQLIGSTTFFSSISTQLSLGSFNILGAGLFVLWALSPLGAHSALRVISADIRQSTSSVELDYFDLNARGESMNAAYWSGDNDFAGGLFISSLFGSDDSKESPADPWGNVKIPFITGIGGNTTANSSTWRNIDSHTPPAYASFRDPYIWITWAWKHKL
ncbi:hypothetical protein AJ80_09602 [Polytolypa hystricis UAMH7299]|uniref:Uncharacterized protein n=1 Tax=Polytolypa hystricis (strain UAMH7299) TaxID=1447883 RepID=A0A2B7WN78_POLH7|nr:hypothetical protein AJ80_09602 [Polytolypa hystricis UAMH7299]